LSEILTIICFIVNQVHLSDMGRNLVANCWTADKEGALPELGPYPYVNNCVSCEAVGVQILHC